MIRKYIIVADDSLKGFDEGIEDLERKWGAEEIEPCDDCISRQAVLGIVSGYAERFNDYINSPNDSEVYAYARGLILSIERNINAMPPVTPQPKIGRWIYTPKRRLDDETDEGCVYITDYRCTCSECGGDFGFRKMSDAYCKYCGARMEVKE